MPYGPVIDRDTQRREAVHCTHSGFVLPPLSTMSDRKPMCEMGEDGDVKALSRLLDEGVDAAACEEREP